MAQSRDLEVRIIIKDMNTGEKAQDKLFIHVGSNSRTHAHYLRVIGQDSLLGAFEELCDMLTDSEGES